MRCKLFDISNSWRYLLPGSDLGVTGNVLLFRSKHRAALILVVLLSAAAWMVGYSAAIAANPVGASPDAKNHRAGELKIKPEKHDFGQVTEFAHSAPLLVTAINSSLSASITFSSVVASAPFMIQSDGCSGAPLAAGKPCEVKVVFNPPGVGGVSEQKALTFTDSAKNSPQHVALKGFGIPVRTPPSRNADAYSDGNVDGDVHAYSYVCYHANAPHRGAGLDHRWAGI